MKEEFTFVINDTKTYYRLSDFKSNIARSLFSQAIKLRARLSQLEEELSEKRQQVAAGSNASSLAASILALENETGKLYREVESLEFRARNEEIETTINV